MLAVFVGLTMMLLGLMVGFVGAFVLLHAQLDDSKHFRDYFRGLIKDYSWADEYDVEEL